MFNKDTEEKNICQCLQWNTGAGKEKVGISQT